MINSRNQAMPLVIVQGPKLIHLGRHGPHVPMVLHVSKDEPELLGQLLKVEEQEEGAVLEPRGAELRFHVQEVGRASPSAQGLHLVQLLDIGQLVSKSETILKSCWYGSSSGGLVIRPNTVRRLSLRGALTTWLNISCWSSLPPS
jgi:hypothetical protein